MEWDGDGFELAVHPLCAAASKAAGADTRLGALEKAVTDAGAELMREALRRLVQGVADSAVPVCPDCGTVPHAVKRARSQTIASLHGRFAFVRACHRCARCGRRIYAADAALGLDVGGRASPGVQEACALGACLGPYADAQSVARLAGAGLGPTSVYTVARAQGRRAVELRDRDVAASKDPRLAAALGAGAPAGGTLVVEIDAWNIRERGAYWGATAKRRRKGIQPEFWHWVYCATIFRLDARGKSSSGRAFLASRAFVATRQGLDAFRDQVRAEALRQGIARAEHVIVLADGAAWIWNLAEDLFPRARQRLDAYHAKEHLWTLARTLHADPAAAAQWVRPYIRFLDRRKDGVLDVIRGIEEFAAVARALTDAQRETVEGQIGYFRTHAGRMDYKTARQAGEPVGSGAVESLANRYQCRFKRTGQFWTLDGDEDLLALETLRMNGRWGELFPFGRAA
jgi:hypothetical protein